jgi:hypothetical protein
MAIVSAVNPRVEDMEYIVCCRGPKCLFRVLRRRIAQNII